MEAVPEDKTKKQAKEKKKREKKKIRRWILKAIEDEKGNATTGKVQKFVDSKQEGLVSTSDLKLNLKKLLDAGLIEKQDRKFAIKKTKKTSGKNTKKSAAKKAVGKVGKKK